MRIIFSLSVLILFAGCANSGHFTREIEEPAKMVEIVLGKVPVGTSADDAQQFMIHEGFNCSRETNADFGDRKNIDYIYCDRSVGDIVQRRWQIAIVIRDEKVVEVLGTTGLVGP